LNHMQQHECSGDGKQDPAGCDCGAENHLPFWNCFMPAEHFAPNKIWLFHSPGDAFFFGGLGFSRLQTIMPGRRPNTFQEINENVPCNSYPR
jgi:hypothetical protein